MSAAVVAGNASLTFAEFNAAGVADARSMLAACLDIDRWVAEVERGRPYPHREVLQARASSSANAISWPEVAGALERHPRVGERPAGNTVHAVWSASEQSGVESSDALALAAGNRAYEQCFGYIYLICASGLSGAQILAALRERLTHDDEHERLVVTAELRKIAAVRLAKAITA